MQDNNLRVVSSTRDNDGGLIESTLGRLAAAEHEAQWYRNAYEQAEKEITRMTEELQRAYDLGYVPSSETLAEVDKENKKTGEKITESKNLWDRIIRALSRLLRI
jgi:Asp-tRNA(Asn)/Glu-tRNA(Gln) amidotransferase A subunit family amidase